MIDLLQFDVLDFLAMSQDAVFRDPNRFDHLKFTNRTILHPVGLVAMVISVVAIFLSARRNAIVPIVLLLCFVPSAQRIVLFGIDFQFLRILGLFALVRILVYGESKVIQWRLVDAVMFGVVILQCLLVFPRGASASFMNTVGQGFDTLSMYLIGRCLIRDRGDWVKFAVTMFFASLPILVAFVIEKGTSRNLFAVFGGVPEITAMREGKLRAQGAFAHPILAGVWWAAMLPIFVSMYHASASRYLGVLMAWIGAPVALLLAFLTASSTPIGGSFMALILWAIFPYRGYLVKMRWPILAFLALIHFVSQSGLHGLLLTRITLVSGSTGYHRYRLIQAAIDRMSEWFFLGTRSTYQWGWGLDDVTCQYVAVAVSAGILGLAGLIYTLVVSIRSAYSIGITQPRERWREWMAWGLVSSVAVHALCFVAVTYFGQAVFLYAFTIGVTITLADTLKPVANNAARRTTHPQRRRSASRNPI